jgi:hypothetical protein
MLGDQQMAIRATDVDVSRPKGRAMLGSDGRQRTAAVDDAGQDAWAPAGMCNTIR